MPTWRPSLTVGVIVVILFLATVQFLLFPSNLYSSPNPIPVQSRVSNHSYQQNTQTSVITRWILTLWSFIVSDGRSVLESKERTDIAVLVRRLVVFSVREMNQRLNGTSCPTWWVNPLSVSEFEQKEISPRRTQYNLTFKVQPGQIPFQSIVHLYRPLPSQNRPFSPSQLSYIMAHRLDKFPNTTCSELSLSPELAMICLCPEEKEAAQSVTDALRTEWAKQDPELPTWPPNVSMSVPDYIRFDTMDLYLKSPSNKTNFCGPEVKMLLFISSAPAHIHQREAIRNTFGNFNFLKANGVRLVFLFGVVKDQQLQSEIDEESLEENDIVQADFADSYHNLTLSHLSMYNWVVTHCRTQGSPMPQWLLKADDDFFLNIPLARRIADANPETEMLGVSFCGTPAIRSLAYIHKYYVPRYMYPPDYYAGYLSGVAYLVRTDVLKPLLKASITTPIIHMDDAYVMGLLTREVGIRPQNSALISYGKGDNPCDITLQMSSYVTSNATLEQMWTQFEDASHLDCPLDHSKLKMKPMSDIDQKACLYK